MYRRTAACAAIVAAALTCSVLFAAKPGDAEKGKASFDDNCAVCHNTSTDEKKMGPTLKGLYKRATLKNGKKMSDANVLAVINAGGNGMPSYEDMLNDEEKANVVA